MSKSPNSHPRSLLSWQVCHRGSRRRPPDVRRFFRFLRYLYKEAAIAACENGIRAFKVMLTVLGGPGSGASCTSSSEESASDHDVAFDDDGDCEDSERASPRHSASVAVYCTFPFTVARRLCAPTF